MIRCHFSRILGERKLKISEVSRATGLNRMTLTRLYRETMDRVELDVIEVLCAYFDIGVGELFEYVPGTAGEDGPRTRFRGPNKAALESGGAG
jgi:putative transcriptional regulator